MGTDNLKPLEELKSLDQQIEHVQELGGLKPIFFRLEEIAKANVNDFDVQLAVGDIKQHLVNRGTKLKEMKDTKAAAAPPPLPPAPTLASPIPPEPAPAVPPPAPMAAGPLPAAPPAVPPPIPVPLPVTLMPPVAPMPPPLAGHPGLPATGPWATTENALPAGPPAAMPTGAVKVPLKPQDFADATTTGAATTGKSPAGPAPVSKTEVKPPAKPVAKRQGPPFNWKRAVAIGIAVGVLLAAIIAGVVVHKRHLKEAAASAAIQVEIATTPPGASVRVNGEAQCVSNCSVALAPGNYQITAFLDGYEPAASGIAVGAGQPTQVNLTLEPQAQSLRIITDLDQGKVTIDGDPPADLQEGQYTLDRVLPGPHTVKVTGKNGEASFSFEIADAKQPTHHRAGDGSQSGRGCGGEHGEPGARAHQHGSHEAAGERAAGSGHKSSGSGSEELPGGSG